MCCSETEGKKKHSNCPTINTAGLLHCVLETSSLPLNPLDNLLLYSEHRLTRKLSRVFTKRAGRRNSSSSLWHLHSHLQPNPPDDFRRLTRNEDRFFPSAFSWSNFFGSHASQVQAWISSTLLCLSPWCGVKTPIVWLFSCLDSKA